MAFYHELSLLTLLLVLSPRDSERGAESPHGIPSFRLSVLCESKLKPTEGVTCTIFESFAVLSGTVD